MSSITGPKHSHNLRPGEHYVFRDRVDIVHVSEGHRVRIFEGPNEGSKKACAPFLAGSYTNAHRTAPHHAKAMRDDRPKLVIVEKTGIKPRELLTLRWRDETASNRELQQRLEPGEWDAKDDDLRNDSVEIVEVPKNATVELYDNSGMGGDFITLNPGWHDLHDYGLARRVSSVVFKSDDWKELRQRLGTARKVEDIGPPIIEPVEGHGPPGTEVELVATLQRTASHDVEWHVSATLGESVTIKEGGDASPVSAEQTVFSEQETGGGETKGDELTRGGNLTIRVRTGPDGRAAANINAQPQRVEQQVWRDLENIRTGATTSIEGTLPAERYRFRFDVTAGVGLG